eukprot:1124838-Amphidinium_carterae.1
MELLMPYLFSHRATMMSPVPSSSPKLTKTGQQLSELLVVVMYSKEPDKEARLLMLRHLKTA